MFAYQGRGIGAPGLESADDGGRRRGIAERHGEIAEPAFVTDAPDRAALGLREPRGFVPVEEPDEVGRVQAVARREIGLRADLRELVPGAEELAVVSSVHAVADERDRKSTRLNSSHLNIS